MQYAIYLCRVYQACCGKTVCTGCMYCCWDAANLNCPFCRKPVPKGEEEMERLNSRVAANDAEAFHQLGYDYLRGTRSLPQDVNKAMELLSRAIELGSNAAHLTLANEYFDGQDVGIDEDRKKAKYHWEIAAMTGDEEARYNLGVFENDNGNINRAMKHWMIAATAGHDLSLGLIKQGFEMKDDYEKTLRAHKDSVEEMKSVNRDNAAAVYGWAQERS